MKEAIDVVFFNRKGSVLKIEKSLRPWIPWVMKFGAVNVLELPDGTLDKWSIEKGERLEITDV